MSSEQWTLSVSNRGGYNRKFCTGVAVNNTLLQFEPDKPAYTFRSSKEAWYFWYRFRKFYPSKCQGMYAEVAVKRKAAAPES